MNPVAAWTIGIALFLIGIIATVAPGVGLHRTADIQELYSQVETIRNNMAPLFMTQANRYGSAAFATTELQQDAVLPSSITVTSGGTMENQFAGQVVITGNNAQLFIDEGGLDQATCIAALAGIPQGSGIVAAAAAADISSLSGATTTALPITTASAESQCSSTSNAIRFVAE
jgi:hypothetical protein